MTQHDPVDPEDAMPLYLQVKETLKEHIFDGEYAVGDQLPSESQLRTAFGVSRVTVRQALQALQDEQLIESIQGKGHFVRRPKVVQSLMRLKGLRESFAEAGFDVRNRVIATRECAADARVAEGLRVGEGTPVVEIKRVRYINRQAASLDVSYFRPEIGARLVLADLANRDVFEILETDLGIELRAADIVIEVGRAGEEEVAHLGVAAGDPILRIERLTCSIDREPIDFEYVFARGDSHQFRIRVPRL